MRKSEFARLPELGDFDDMNLLNIGSKFLYGNSMIDQKQNKKSGDEISYYIIINKTKGSVEYTPIFDVLETDGKGE